MVEAGDSDASQKVSTAKKICLGFQSENKRCRKQSYLEFQKFLSDKSLEFSQQDLRNIFNETQMYVLNGLRDKAETVREEAINFISFLIIETLPLNDYYLTYIFPVLVERIGTVELIEESEEIRLQLLQLTRAIVLKYSQTEQLKPFLGDIVTILSEIVKDKFPAVKELGCKCITDLSIALPRDFHMQSEMLIKPVITCCYSHQRYKVRVEAIKCTGDIVMHSSCKALDEAVGPLAERLFDQIPLVRITVAQVAARWLMEYRDRYSFFHKILPLLLTGLNDEVPETREEAAELWEKVGLQFQEENEKDMKDQLDYLTELPKYYPLNLKRPNLGCRTLVQRNVGKLANALGIELQSWQSDIRIRCSQLLCSIALSAEDGLTMHLQDLLPSMFFAARSDDDRVKLNIVRAAELMGSFISIKTWSKLVIPAIENGAHYGHLAVLAGFIRGSPREELSDHLHEITGIISHNDICYTRKKKLQRELVECGKAIAMKYSNKTESQVGYDLFKILISLISLRDPENIDIDLSLLEDLTKAIGLESTYHLWSKYCNNLLHHINIDPQLWTVVTFERCILDTILVESNEAFGENLDILGDILSQALNPEADPESRLKTFLSLSVAFEKKSVIFKNSTNVTGFLEKLITEVFVPSLVWHAGLTAEAMRTMAAACLCTALRQSEGVELFSDEDVLGRLSEELLPLLLSLMEDASYKSRMLAIDCLILLKEIRDSKNVWSVDELIKVYPEILKRLDDPTDQVRTNALENLSVLYKNCPDDFKSVTYSAHHELIIDTLLLHYDDEDEAIQDLVFNVLITISEVNKEELIKKVERHKPLLANQKGCNKILQYLQEVDNN